MSGAERQRRYRERHPDRIQAYAERTRERKRVRSRKNYADRRDRYGKVRNAYRRRVRAAVLGKYGAKCVCCDEREPRFLGVDHIKGDGKADRKEKGLGYAFYLWLYRNEPDHERYRLLCHNCNFARGHYGVCPHEEQREAIA